jgi:hypothetical protein
LFASTAGDAQARVLSAGAKLGGARQLRELPRAASARAPADIASAATVAPSCQEVLFEPSTPFRAVAGLAGSGGVVGIGICSI